MAYHMFHALSGHKQGSCTKWALLWVMLEMPRFCPGGGGGGADHRKPGQAVRVGPDMHAPHRSGPPPGDPVAPALPTQQSLSTILNNHHLCTPHTSLESDRFGRCANICPQADAHRAGTDFQGGLPRRAPRWHEG